MRQNETVIFIVAFFVMYIFFGAESKFDHIQLYHHLGERVIPLAIGLLVLFELKTKFRLIFALIPLILGFSYEFYQLPKQRLAKACINHLFEASVYSYHSVDIDTVKQEKTSVEQIGEAPSFSYMKDKDFNYIDGNLTAEVNSFDYLCIE